MARSGVCYGAKSVLESKTTTAFSPVVLTDNQEQQRTNIKRWNTAYKLWKLKSSQPHLFSNIEQLNNTGREIGPGIPSGGLPTELPGFEPVRLPSGAAAPGWLTNGQRQIYLERSSERCLCFDSTASVYRELHIGDDLVGELMLSGVATTTSASNGSTSGSQQTSSTSQAARHLVIMDLHKAAEAFRLDLNHLDRPAAMLAVYRSAEDSVPPDAAAKGLHEKLLRRLAAFRSRATDDILQAVLIDSIQALASEHNAAGIAGGVAVIVGAKLVVGVGRGAACVIADPLPGDMRDIRVAAASTDSSSSALTTACVELDCRSAACVLLHTAGIQEEAARSAAAHASKGHLRAGALGLMQALSVSHAGESRAAACARLMWVADGSDEPAAKRARADKGVDKVRCRQILLKYVGCKQATDPVRRKPVRRSLAEAEMAMLEVLDTLEKASDPQGAFTQQCRSLSECASSLKGGDLAGDVGWLRRPEVKPGEKISKELAARMVVIRAALALEIGEVSDVVVAEDGVHLLKRSA